MKKITILGSTGSIGTQTLDVVRNHPGDFEVVALTAGSNAEKMAEQILEFQPGYAVMKDHASADRVKKLIQDKSNCDILVGMDGFIQVSTISEVDIVVAAMVGMIGLRPVIEAIKAGKDIALANKETLVTAGHLIIPLVKEKQVRLLPVDSEHSAIFQSMQSRQSGKDVHNQVSKIYLTASGGPFRNAKKEDLYDVTVEQALAHPNWSMGPKITTDSATMMNKGLEIIEAKWLFDVDLDQIHVLIQPQSIIHSMVEFVDGAVMAQLGTPDMRLPIQYALYYPERVQLPGERLDFGKIGSIHFEEPNTEVLRGIPLATASSREGGSMPTVMNAANEYAVARFLNKDIKFLQIYDMIEFAMEHHKTIKHPSLEEILAVEQETYNRLQKDWRK
ncbi:MAG: 1-deoxy-D-xylulose-5-phosphate reductoisomerase [Eubacterium sp.]|nr:1-deoxy-D-xylulose-5-phosphate reductoisomerase [Eubacterium sp.]